MARLRSNTRKAKTHETVPADRLGAVEVVVVPVRKRRAKQDGTLGTPMPLQGRRRSKAISP